MTKTHGGKILARRLHEAGVQRVFSVPGESFLAALDGLYDLQIENVVCRQEGGASMMAEAHAKLTGDPGVLFVTRGPGATNASSGLHVAMHDATPLVCFVGQVPLRHRDRGVFQEVDYRAFFGPLVKWVAEVETTGRLSEYVDKAFRIATSGRPGPVVLALPEDVLSAEAEDISLVSTKPLDSEFSDRQLAQVASLLDQAERPLLVLGGSQWEDDTAPIAADAAHRWGLPVAVTFRRQDYINNDHPNYAGDLGVGMNPKLGQRLSEADLIVLAGAELNDITTKDFSLVDVECPPKIVQVATDPDSLGKHYPFELGYVVSPAQFLTALRDAKPDAAGPDRGAKAARAEYEAWQEPQETPGAVKLEQVVRRMADVLPHDTIVTNGAGNYAAFLHRYYRFRKPNTQLAPTSGSMGYGLPAAISAKLHHPDRTVICFAGDGCLQMTVNELSTVAQYGAGIIVIVANNGRYGTIRMHQEMHYPGRVSGTELFNPDYTALASAYGGTGHVVEETAQFGPALEAAMEGGLHIIELRLDRQMLSTTKSL